MMTIAPDLRLDSASRRFSARRAPLTAHNTDDMPSRLTRTESQELSRDPRRRGPFSDALAVGGALLIALAMTGCAKPAPLGGPGSPLGKARINVVLPAKPPATGRPLHFESPEYARRDRELGLRR